ncbi:pyrroloquinoline quinone biosynthesis protein PqqB [Aquabacterium sp. A7-Y]|uniref:pyrroloquinoline quinone biosynthesis protein PqqB n=1 Tax=Aquabacterium sp. A7-Y TaxID=1349605 RepID=UPI00223D5876|nr:pyrroloquinoline quinone biosynthesis protein PqqB [Aquabacterium sp. A7-Y]MCW7539345.1 pyrroloquinoline quinone biosynthesis protein PqqB [Aquabacterium sp. A7-Y]
MKILVLGSGAGGGYPQWNCNCQMCRGLRTGRLRARARTQSSIAVSDDGEHWVLINASPDLGQQLREQPALHPRHGQRHTPIRAVVLMDAQVDHVTGLLSLREGPPIELHCTPCVLDDLRAGLPLLPMLEHYCGVRVHVLPVSGDTHSADFTLEALPGLRFTALAIPGKAPPYSPHRHAPATGDNIALRVVDTRSGAALFYAPGLAEVGPGERRWMQEADCLMVDGTFWREDEMPAAGLGRKHAAEMGHLPQSRHAGRPGMVDALAGLPARRKILIHINNSNPILDEDGPERALLTQQGIEVAFDGMEIEL